VRYHEGTVRIVSYDKEDDTPVAVLMVSPEEARRLASLLTEAADRLCGLRRQHCPVCRQRKLDGIVTPCAEHMMCLDL
jgi:hypothetical protein